MALKGLVNPKNKPKIEPYGLKTRKRVPTTLQIRLAPQAAHKEALHESATMSKICHGVTIEKTLF